jgi:hypothetical protein
MKSNKKKHQDLFERYKIIVAARNFHYANFNKWLTYFYIANAAIFVGYIQLLSLENNNLRNLEYVSLPVLFLGFIAGLFLYWSSKGYYYWNINFIMLVNHYEKDLLKWKKRKRIYSMFSNKKEQNNYSNPLSGANFSTSKIAILFAYIIATSWGIVLSYTLFKLVYPPIFEGMQIICAFGISTVTSFLIVFLLSNIKKNDHHYLWSNTDPLHNLKIKQ